MSETIVEQLDHIFKPKSVAIIGASSTMEKWGGRLLRRALQSNYRGNIYPVNPKAKELMGVKAYADVRDIPGEVELAVFTVMAAQVPVVMTACVEKGVKGGVIISADFAETGETGKRLEEETAKIARAGNLRFVGPNCNGIWCSASNLNITPIEDRMSGPVAFISQSGSFGGIANRLTSDRGYGLSKFIAIGNQGDLTATDFLEYLSYDDDTKVITMYMEGFKDGARFFESREKSSGKKTDLADERRPFLRGRPCYDVSYRFDSRIGRCFRRHMQAGGNYKSKSARASFHYGGTAFQPAFAEREENRHTCKRRAGRCCFG